MVAVISIPNCGIARGDRESLVRQWISGKIDVGFVIPLTTSPNMQTNFIIATVASMLVFE